MNIIAVSLTQLGVCFAVVLLFEIETVTKDFRLKIDFVSFHLALSDFCQYISIVFFCLQW